MNEFVERINTLPFTTFAVYMFLWTVVVILITVLVYGISLRKDIAELKQDNMKLRYKNKLLEGFAAAYQEEKDKEYVRGYYDSIGVYDI